jgi:hypothetical protein
MDKTLQDYINAAIKAYESQGKPDKQKQEPDAQNKEPEWVKKITDRLDALEKKQADANITDTQPKGLEDVIKKFL